NEDFSGHFGLWPTTGEDTLSQLGSFTNGLSSVGIENGIILSTGRVDEAVGPNTSNFTSFLYDLPSTDPDLMVLSNGNLLFDAVVFEFDFVPTTDTIDFDYVFASEEYCEAFNLTNADVFAFLISGPGINGPFSDNAENIAILPDGLTTINVTSINHQSNSEFFRSNVLPSFANDCDLDNPIAPDDIEYDGMTTLLTARSPVIPCETYHLKLIIADVGDSFFDSAILLRAGSFAAGLVDVSEPGATAESDGLANAPLEGCSDGQLVFNRVDNDVSEDLTVYFNISPTGTAEFGVDYTMETDSFTIPAGQLSDTLIVDIFSDNIPEGTESIILRLTGTCNCDENTTEFFIVDPAPLDMTLPEPTDDCAGTSVDLIPTVNGGEGAYMFDWSSGGQDSIEQIVRLPGDSMIILTVTDACEQSEMDTVLLETPDIQASLSGAYSLCDGPTAMVPIVLSGGTNYTVTIRENGTNDITLTGSSDTIWLEYSSAIDIEILSVSADGCDGVVQGSATVTDSEFTISAIIQEVN
ncbi:MAG: choice-of-anchor L domain-containing protein, partial [Bacteroidota bacterium]